MVAAAATAVIPWAAVAATVVGVVMPVPGDAGGQAGGEDPARRAQGAVVQVERADDAFRRDRRVYAFGKKSSDDFSAFICFSINTARPPSRRLPKRGGW